MSRFSEADAAAVLKRNQRTPPAPAPRPARSVKENKPIPGAAVTKAQVSIDTLLFQLQAAQLPMPEREFVFAKPLGRRWRFDLAYPNRGLAIEVEGLVFPPKPRWHEGPADHRLSGRHVSVTGYLDDIEKYAQAWSLGWSVLRVLHKQIESGEALMLIERRLALPTVWVPTS